MSRWARPDNFGHHFRTPLLRRHWVYRAYDEGDDLLYLGCTHTPERRMAAHRSGSDWFDLAVTFKMSGPHNYEVARELEHVGLTTERPLYGFSPDRRTIVAARRRIFQRRYDATPGDIHAKCRAAEAHAESLIHYPGNRAPFRITDLTVKSALRAERQDANDCARRSA